MSIFQRSQDEGFIRGDRAILALPDRGGSDRDTLARLDEAVGLAAAIGLEVVSRHYFRLRQPRPATLFGSGQVAQIAQAVIQDEAALVIVDASLTPVQQRNLENQLTAKVIDRTGLILEIFGERAATAEGRLQVELAHLDYQASRLVRSWTHLERQRGGFGFLGGPGETQIEADRRMIRERMAKLRRELAEVRRTRGLHRDRRKRAPWPVIALIGYTNAGKSTLFNQITGADVLAQDLLFATLDPTMRHIRLPGIDKAILSNTVGFVSDLPTQLIAAFQATLEEVTAADLIFHVRDIAHPDTESQKLDVQAVLAEIGASGADGAPIIELWNKCDLLNHDDKTRLSNEAERRADVVMVSALTGQGTAALCQCAAALLTKGNRLWSLDLDVGGGAALAWLHAHGQVPGQSTLDNLIKIDVRLSLTDMDRFQTRFGR